MEHIYFEAQLCSEIATLKEKSTKATEQKIHVWRIEQSRRSRALSPFLFLNFPLQLQFHYIIGPRNKYGPLDMMFIYMFHCGLAGKHLYLRPQNSRRSRPPKAADFFGRYFVFCTDVFLQVHNETCR